MKRREIKRTYLALVEGHPGNGTWDSPLTEGENLNVYTDPDGTPAITHFETIKNSKKRSLLKISLETGRKHQIRVHCKAAGCPIVGDPRYGKKSRFPMALHSDTIVFTHPVTEKQMEFTARKPRWLTLFSQQLDE